MLNNILTCIGSAYGPSDIYNPKLINIARQKITEMSTKCHMVAGDFNCHTTNTRIIPDITI